MCPLPSSAYRACHPDLPHYGDARNASSGFLDQSDIAQFGELGGNRKLSLVFTGLLTLAQLVSFATLLALSIGDTCDQPFTAFIIVHTTRLEGLLQLRNRPSRNDANPEETIRLRESRRAIGTPAWDARVRLFMDAQTLLAFTWFLLGNYFFFSSHTCRTTSPELYWTSLVVLIFGWLYCLEIIFIVLAVTFFLPIVILGIRLFGWGQKKAEVGPCTKEQIDKIPLVLYIPAPEESSAPAQVGQGGNEAVEMQDRTTTEAGASSPSTGAASSQPTKPSAPTALEPMSSTPAPTATPRLRRRGKMSRLLFGVKAHRGKAGTTSYSSANPSYIPAPYPLQPLPANQSTCPICLCDYEPPPLSDSGVDPSNHEWEPLRKLVGCGHCFHQGCLDEWLGTSGRCPLCQEPVEVSRKGKKSNRARGESRFGGLGEAAESG